MQSAGAIRLLTRSALLVILVGGLSGCALFGSYPRAYAPARVALEQGIPERAIERFERKQKGRLNRLCWLLEEGALRHYEGKYEESRAVFEEALQLIEEQERKAVISVSDVGAELASLLVNEQTIPYRGESFERILLHSFQAVNYLFLEQPEGARVEILRAYALQKEEAERHWKEMEKLRTESQRRGMEVEETLEHVREKYQEEDEATRRVANAYQNPWTYYLSGLVFALHGEANDAYIDFKHVYELNPRFTPLKFELVKYASELGFREELAKWERVFGIKAEELREEGKWGELLVVFHDGWAPLKEEIKLPIPVRGGVIFVALPFYQRLESAYDRMEIWSREGGRLGVTEVLCDVEATAIKYLKDKVLRLVLKQLLRGAIRGVATAKVYDEVGIWGGVGMSILNFFTEQADRRSWLTLPRNIQFARIWLEPGGQNLSLIFRGRSEKKVALPLEVKAGELYLVQVRNFGSTVMWDVVKLREGRG